MTLIWLDTEFVERGPDHPIELISIGLVNDEGRELYLESADFDPARATPWIAHHVLPLLGSGERLPHSAICDRIIDFVGLRVPEFWGYCSAYDWVVFCQLFGRMVDLPDRWPKWCNDIKQLAWTLGNPKLPSPGDNEHNALADAQWNREVWLNLQALAEAGQGEYGTPGGSRG